MESRGAWDAFRARFHEIDSEFTRALTELVSRFDVSERSNRFIIGDVVEYVIAASFFTMNILVLPRGGNQNDFDLDSLVASLRAKFSIKSSFSDSRPAIGLKNKQGNAPWTWTDPVIFVLTGIGIVYADPAVDTELAARVYDGGDAFRLKIDDIEFHAQANLDCLIPARIPVNPRTGREKAGRSVFVEIVDHPAYPLLKGFLERSRAATAGTPIFEALDEARQRRDSGDLTNEAYEQLVAALIARVGRPS